MATVFDGRTNTALNSFPGELIEQLADLADEDEQTALIALQVFPFGYRALLAAHGLASADAKGTWRFTDEGQDFLTLCDEHTHELSIKLDGLSQAVKAL